MKNQVETAKHSLILSLPGLFETNEAMNRAASKIFTYDLPVSYYSDWLKKIGDIKTEQVNRAANWAAFFGMAIGLILTKGKK